MPTYKFGYFLIRHIMPFAVSSLLTAKLLSDSIDEEVIDEPVSVSDPSSLRKHSFLLILLERGVGKHLKTLNGEVMADLVGSLTGDRETLFVEVLVCTDLLLIEQFNFT